MEPAERTHPGEQDLNRFMHGELRRPEAREVVRHLLAGCPQCVAVTRRLWSLGRQWPPLLHLVSAAGEFQSKRS